MKMTVRYRQYKNSEEATMWSRIGGYLTTYAFIVVIGLFALLNPILKGITPSSSSSIAAFVLAVVLAVGSVVFCSKMEKKCLLRDMPSRPDGAELTPEQIEKLRIIKEMLEKQKAEADHRSGGNGE